MSPAIQIVSVTSKMMGLDPTSSKLFKFDFMPIAAMEITRAKRDISVAPEVIAWGTSMTLLTVINITNAINQ